MRLRGVLVGVVLGVSALLNAGPAAADPPVQCAPGMEWDPVEAECVITVESPGRPRERPPVEPIADGGGQSSRDGDGPAVDPTCRESVKDTVVECELAGGWHWVGAWNAFAKSASPQPPKSDPVWQGNTDGAVYDLGRWLGNPDLDPEITGQRWSASPPWEALPDPRQLAARAVQSMNLRAIEIGIVPHDEPGSVGLVGLPTWMWAEGPAPNSVGPITRSASAAGHTVTATGRVQQVVWDMGDGTTVICAGPGTPYEDRFMDADSPDCGHRYQQPGEYPVTATTQWAIAWEGLGQSGTIAMQLQRTTTITIGEAQVLAQNS